MSRTLRDYRSVFKPVGAVLIGYGGALALCAGVGLLLDGVPPAEPPAWRGCRALGWSALATVGLGAGLFAFGRRHASAAPTRREAMLTVALIWIAAAVCGALPLMLGPGLAPVEALFESTSGLTTTGATVITDIDGTLSAPVMLWRQLLQWLGGMGIVVLFVAVFPNVGAGGKHMFRGEVPGTTAEGLKPRVSETSIALWKIYAALTVVEVGVLTALGVHPFEAVCHALTTMSTGGFSPRDASIAGFDNPAVEYAITVFMFLAAVNFGLYFAALQGRNPKVVFRSLEFRIFVLIVVLAAVALTVSNLGVYGGSVAESFRYSLFQAVTFVTSTGYTSDDYMAYPPGALAIVLILMLVGGSSGSTAGGIKVERIVLMAKQSWAEVHESFRPSVVRVVRMGRQAIQRSVLADVGAFFVVYTACLAVGVALVAYLEGLPVPTAFGATLSCLSNMGPAPFHAGADNFADYSSSAKIVFALAMLLGRLEFFTLLALLVPSFWKR